MQSKAATVAEYLASLPADRREAIEAVRRVILKNLDPGYIECMSYGAIGYAVPHSIYPAGYHCDPKLPLPFAGLGWQKNHMSLGLMCTYWDASHNAWFRSAWLKTGKKLDMGKCCIRFRRVEDVPLEVIGEAVRRVPAKDFIAYYEKCLGQARTAAAARKSKVTRSKKKTPAKKPAKKKLTRRSK